MNYFIYLYITDGYVTYGQEEHHCSSPFFLNSLTEIRWHRTDVGGKTYSSISEEKANATKLSLNND